MDDKKETLCESIKDTSVNLEMKHIIPLEHLDEINTGSEILAVVENPILIGYGWVYDLVANMTFDLYEDVSKGGSSHIGFLVKYFSFSNIQKKNEGNCRN